MCQKIQWRRTSFFWTVKEQQNNVCRQSQSAINKNTLKNITHFDSFGSLINDACDYQKIKKKSERRLTIIINIIWHNTCKQTKANILWTYFFVCQHVGVSHGYKMRGPWIDTSQKGNIIKIPLTQEDDKCWFSTKREHRGGWLINRLGKGILLVIETLQW